MSHDEYLLALDELESRFKNLKLEISVLSVLKDSTSTNLGKLTLQLEHLKSSIAYSKNKAKVVDFKTYIKSQKQLDECKSQLAVQKAEQAATIKKLSEAQEMLKTIKTKIDALKARPFGKVLHHDFRRN